MLLTFYFFSYLQGTLKEEASVDSESDIGGLLHDIHEALIMARDHRELPPVRILRILAGESSGIFSSEHHSSNTSNGGGGGGVPLSAAMDYVGVVLDESSGNIIRLKVSSRWRVTVLVS